MKLRESILHRYGIVSEELYMLCYDMVREYEAASGSYYWHANVAGNITRNPSETVAPLLDRARAKYGGEISIHREVVLWGGFSKLTKTIDTLELLETFAVKLIELDDEAA